MQQQISVSEMAIQAVGAVSQVAAFAEQIGREMAQARQRIQELEQDKAQDELLLARATARIEELETKLAAKET